MGINYSELNSSHRLDTKQSNSADDFNIRIAILRGLEPFERTRYLKQLPLQGYTPEQIRELADALQNNQ